MLAALKTARALLPAGSPSLPAALRAFSTQLDSLSSVLAGLKPPASSWQPQQPNAAVGSGAPASAAAPASSLLGQHALLPETARALAELQAAPAPALAPQLEEALDDLSAPSSGLDEAWQCHTKRTYQPSLIIRKRRHGWLQRSATPSGRRTIARRKAKGRWRLTA